MKYPIGIETFRELIEDGYVYVDKTDLVYRLVTEGKVYFLSRPRRFGKSLLVSTLESYFLGQKELFRGLKIDALEKDWIEYPVLTLSFAKGEYDNPQTLESNIENFLAKAEQQYDITPRINDISVRFYNVLEAAYEKTGRRAVVLIDEYDKPLLDVMALSKKVKDGDGYEITMEEYNRRILKGFYGVFKAADRYTKFVLLTGVTKFSQVSVFSGFNQPKDISMDGRYEALCGITKDEMLTVFDKPIHELAENMRLSYDEMVETLKKRYDGYHFGEKMTDIFNPFSLINCFDSMRIADYWFASGTPTYLVRLLCKCNADIYNFTDKYFRVAEFENYRADTQRPLPMLYQSGYLTIKGYNSDQDRYLLDFPNEEVRTGLIDTLACDFFGDDHTPLSFADEARIALEAGNVEEFMNLITAFMASAPYHLQRKNDAKECERYFQTSFYYIVGMIQRRNTVLAEKNTSQGRIDFVITCPNYVYIIEFKLNDSAEAAMQQIKERGYAKPYAADKRKVMMLGINFSSETGTIEEWKVEPPHFAEG